MFSAAVKSRAGTGLLVLLVLAVAGSGLNRLAAPAWADVRAREPALTPDAAVAAAGQGVTLALLGGFRALVADGAWLQMYDLWERRDLPAVQTLLQTVATLDPRPVYFWLNGARILAHDFSHWRIAALGGYEVTTPDVQRRIDAEQAQQALRHLERAMHYHPARPELWVERAGIELMRLRDVAAAAESYRRAWELPGGPYYAARLHAELLRRAGRRAEALAWLVRLHPRLPPGDEAAAADVVLGRIRDLERELGVPPTQAYQEAATAPGRTP
jgi:tetratricopeptide (TPR) repeat protein